ncbi:MobA/MobL family protein, partial [Blautia faecis]|nr:MobA/MobL family protein [Blautia faecis]
MLPEIYTGCAERRNPDMAIFHYTIKIVGRSKGKSVISASAYLNGDVMKNEETGRISYYTSKKEVVYTSLMMCENAPPEWQIVPEENIKRFQKSVRYKRSEDKEAALEKFKITFQKQRLWNEVLKIEKSADAQLGRSFEFALPKEWSRQEQIQYTSDYIQKTFVDKGMCADWSIHDKGDGNPHVHLLLTMRPFNPDHSWGKKEVKDWDFVRDKSGNIVIDESHPDWWQDKKNPDRHGIRIPVLDENGIQKIGARNRLQWKRVLTDATGWNNPKNCELWRSEWAKVCNEHLPLHNQVNHRSYEKQGKLQIPTIHEGADARKIEQKFLAGQEIKGSWKVAENQIIKQQNTLLQKILDTFGKVSGALSLWKERLNDIRRKPG